MRALNPEQIAQVVHAASREFSLVTRNVRIPPWDALPNENAAYMVRVVEHIIKHADAGPAATWDYMRKANPKAGNADRVFDMLPNIDQYFIFLVRGIVLSQINW